MPPSQALYTSLTNARLTTRPFWPTFANSQSTAWDAEFMLLANASRKERKARTCRCSREDICRLKTVIRLVYEKRGAILPFRQVPDCDC